MSNKRSGALEPRMRITSQWDMINGAHGNITTRIVRRTHCVPSYPVLSWGVHPRKTNQTHTANNKQTNHKQTTHRKTQKQTTTTTHNNER